jgi:predicted DNA-binding transcriptional regulator AlpA
MTEDRLIRIKELMQIICISRAQIYRLIAEQKLPKPHKIGRTSLFSFNEVQKAIENLKNT